MKEFLIIGEQARVEGKPEETIRAILEEVASVELTEMYKEIKKFEKDPKDMPPLHLD